MFLGGEISYNDEVMITRARQKDALQQAKESFLLVRDGAAMSVPEDLLTIDLMNAYEELGKVIGESVEEDLVNEILASSVWENKKHYRKERLCVAAWMKV